MNIDLRSVAGAFFQNRAVAPVLAAYDNAPHRIDLVPDFEEDAILAAYRRSTFSLPAASRIHIIPGMGNLSPSPLFHQTLEKIGYEPLVLDYDGRTIPTLRQWQENTVALFEKLILDPTYLGLHPVFLGHSAGGVVAYLLAALAHGASPERIIEVLAATEVLSGVITPASLSQLAVRLRESRSQFIALGMPLHGVRFYMGEKLPNLVLAISEGTLKSVYDHMGVHPEDVLDSIAYSATPPETIRGHMFGTMFQESVRLSYIACTALMAHRGPHDGIVYVEVARPRSADGLSKSLLVGRDHLKMVETPDIPLLLGADAAFRNFPDLRRHPLFERLAACNDNSLRAVA